MAVIGWLCLACLQVATAGGQGESATESAAVLDPRSVLGTFGALRVSTSDVFPDPDLGLVLPSLVNGIHWTTREGVVHREAWFEAGQTVTEGDRRELERNLRATGLFGEVVVRAVPGELPETVDFAVETRDRLSLIFGVSGALVGSVGEVAGTLGESNLLGLGDQLVVRYEQNTEDELTGTLNYRDRHFLGRFLRFDLEAGVTEEGERYGVRFSKPLQHLGDQGSWLLGASFAEAEVDFFEGGSTVAEVPERTTQVFGEWSAARGPRTARWRFGAAANFDDRAFGPAVGQVFGGLVVPGDTRTAFVGPLIGFDRFVRFDEVTGLDTLDFVQDLSLGSSIELRVGPSFRNERGQSSQTQLGATLGARTAFAPTQSSYITGTASGTLRQSAGRAVGWSASTSLHGYQLFSAHTLAGSLTYDQVFESENLLVELTLGEDNGLRGYPAREFSGERRIRLNLEERFDTGLEFSSLELGLVGFFDAGWVAERDQSLSDPFRSIGVGLRLGSSEFFGGGVLRFDVAFPLDEIPGGSDNVQISVALGQVFSFFGNQANLSTR